MIFIDDGKRRRGSGGERDSAEYKSISIGIPAIRNTTEKTAETTKNVPIDCTKVMPMICLPELAIFLN